ncbi:cystathionine beta-synthase [Psychromicrobium xiongbiense]|uniref:cystathionine beta-synthase n=1 Tax=Psychromicrobium xiongbiense TaxID=3051184 RepID=UPI002553CA02|nr:cystathionine beta-synthase [Psychromicrobium sp. YIM S02556]
MKYAQSVLDLIGNTPLVRLNKVTEGIAATVLAKVEYLNPGGSAKDRIAVKMLDEAERAGKILPGGTVVEPTSGNTGVALAMVAQQRGYRCIFTVPDKVSEDKRATLQAYGAEVVVTPTAVAPDSPQSYYGVADRLVSEIPGAYKPDQFSNPFGPLSHFETTGPEIWRDTDGLVTHVVIGVGTGGTITGTGRYLREVSQDRPGGEVQVIGVDPEGSVYSGGTGRPYLVEGVGEDIWPASYDPSVPHEILAVSDAESFAMTRRLAREEGLLVGGSSGMAVVAALRVARTLGPDDVVVVLLPDSGRGYLGKIFNDEWMQSYGFLSTSDEPAVGELLRGKSGQLPDLVHIHPNETVRDVIRLLGEYGVSQVPVLTAEPPVVMGEVIGTVDERVLTEKLFRNEAKLTDKITEHMSPVLPMIGSLEPISAAREKLQDVDALLVTFVGAPVGILTRHDLLFHLQR